jgi:hypothetical protein
MVAENLGLQNNCKCSRRSKLILICHIYIEITSMMFIPEIPWHYGKLKKNYH